MVLSNEDYERFVEKNKIKDKKRKIMNTDSEGYIILDKKNYLSSNIPMGNACFGKEWIGLNNLQLALIKERIPDKKQYKGVYTNEEKEILIANNFVLPELAKQFGLDVAKYYQVKYEGSDRIYLLTPSFLKEDEELIHLSNIVGDKNLCIPDMLEKIDSWLTDLGYNREDIEVIKIKFLKQSIFNRFIEFTDEHNENAGIIVNGENRTARIAPIYDIDFSVRVYNQSSYSFAIIHSRYTDDRESVELEDMLNYYKDLPWIKNYIGQILEDFDIDVALDKGQQNGNLTLSEKAKTKYNKFFKEQVAVLEEFIQELNQDAER